MISNASDVPATTWPDPDDVLVSIKPAVDSKAYDGADIVHEEGITVPRALGLHTARSFELPHCPNDLGRIAEGFETSFTVLDRSILAVDRREGSPNRPCTVNPGTSGEKVHERRGRRNPVG